MSAALSTPIHAPHWTPPSPHRTHKRQRLSISLGDDLPPQTQNPLLLPQLPTVLQPDVPGDLLAFSPLGSDDVDMPLSPPHVADSTLPPTLSAGLQSSLDELEHASQAYRLRQVTNDRDDNQTGHSYGRHIRRYELFWADYQARLSRDNPHRTAIPAQPITPAKASMFLQHESTREKLQCKRGAEKTIAGSNLGKAHIAQVTSALESWRLHHAYLYKDQPDAQVPLRSDIRVRTFERSAKHNEPKRIEQAQSLKAVGTSSDTYTHEELSRCSLYFLKSFSGPRKVFVALRDRAMALSCGSTAARGDSARMLLWSDLFMTGVPMNDIALGATVPALVMLADNAKHNQQGRIDEYGAFRHRLVDLCPVGALSMLFFAQFHILPLPPPQFEPDFDDKECGEYGRRDWYRYHVFWGSSMETAMSYENHCERVTTMHEHNGISISKVTHATRNYAAKTSRSHGSTTDGTKALGGWMENGSYRAVYDRALPVDALLGAAMFNGRRPESYFLPRDVLEPPAELLGMVFPWIEDARADLQARVKVDRRARNFALDNFLCLLTWLRRVLLQDAAVLYSAHPSCPIFHFAPFTSPLFRDFASDALPTILKAEKAADLMFQKLPEHMVQSVKGVATHVSLAQQQHQAQFKGWQSAMSDQYSRLEGMMGMMLGSKAPRKRGKLASPPVPVPAPAPPSHAPPPSHPSVDSLPPLSEPGMPVITINISGSPLSPCVSSTTTMTTSSASVLSHEPLSHPAPSSPALPSQSLVPSKASTQAHKWSLLAKKYGDNRLQTHKWEWISDDWLPYYKYQTVQQISDIWVEWSDGLGGCLSVRELNEEWGARWRRNNAGQKTEWGRRKKVVDLVTELSGKHRWNTKLALRFLAEKYEPRFKARSFCDYLTKDNNRGRGEVLASATLYP